MSRRAKRTKRASVRRNKGGRILLGAIAVGIGVAIAGLAAWWWSRASIPGTDRTTPIVLADVVQVGSAAGFNVLLITLDTTRRDYVGCYGDEESSTPAIDSLLEHGVRIDDAVVSAPLTLPSHASLLTGRYPPAIGVRDNGSYRLAAEHTTLAETLKEQGYATAAFVSAFVLDRRFGLDQGFDVYDFSASDKGRLGPESLLNEREAAEVTNVAIRWLEQRAVASPTAPFFAWVHYFDPHHPYVPPNGDPAQVHTKLGYRAEIAYMDGQLNRLFEALDQLGLRDRTLIVLVSDHGESLTEHDEREHGFFVYEATVRAAMILSNPLLFDRPYSVADRVVGLVDVVPTTLDLLGLARVAEGDGQSLLTSPHDPERAVYIETYYPREKLGCSELCGLRRHTDKYILAPTPEYYDLRADPNELQNTYAANPAQLAPLKQQLAQLLEQYDQSGQALAGAKRMTSEEVERLRSLGYIGGTSISSDDSRPDPKDRIHIINRLKDVDYLLKRGEYDQALALAQEAMAECEGEFTVHKVAVIYERTNRLPEACRVLQEYVHRHPSGDLLLHLAQYYYRLEEFDLMEESLQVAETLDPLAGLIPTLRGARLYKEERYAEAVAQFERALEIDAERVGPGGQRNLQAAKEQLARQQRR